MADWAIQDAARPLVQRTAPFALLLCLFQLVAVKSLAQDAPRLTDAELCHLFEQKASAVDAAYSRSSPEGFQSVDANADCAKRAYVQNVTLTDLAAASIAQVADEIRSSYVLTTCQDRTVWDLAFDRGWTTTFSFLNPTDDTLLSMTLDSCEETPR